jgi:hypothetical protein
MRFGIRLGPFWVSTSSRRRPSRSQSSRRAESFHGLVRDGNGGEHPCHHSHRTLEAAEECARRQNRRRDEAAQAALARRLGDMSPEEYRRHLAEIDPAYEEQLRHREAATEAVADEALRRMKDELAAEQAREDPGAGS